VCPHRSQKSSLFGGADTGRTPSFSASWDNTMKLPDFETGKVQATFVWDSSANCCVSTGAFKLIVAGAAGVRLHFLRLEEPKSKDRRPNVGQKRACGRLLSRSRPASGNRIGTATWPYNAQTIELDSPPLMSWIGNDRRPCRHGHRRLRNLVQMLGL
jgi:hypothetical protein